MKNPSAQKLINKIEVGLFKNGFDADKLIADLKKLREYSMEEGNPVLTKALRLTYEHLEEYGLFLIPIPDDDPIEEEAEETIEQANENSLPTENNMESLEYLISLFIDLDNKNNMLDLREYNKALQNF